MMPLKKLRMQSKLTVAKKEIKNPNGFQRHRNTIRARSPDKAGYFFLADSFLKHLKVDRSD